MIRTGLSSAGIVVLTAAIFVLILAGVGECYRAAALRRRRRSWDWKRAKDMRQDEPL